MKANKYLFVFVSLFIFFSFLMGVAVYKYYPLLIHHTVYYCQKVTHALSLQIQGNLGMSFIIVIFIVLLFTTIKFFATLFRIYRFRSRLLKNTSEHALFFAPLLKNLELVDKVVTIQSEKPFAFCFGIRSPKIYISTKLISLVTKSELKTILLHERYHLVHRDALTLLIANIGASLFPFFPLLSDLIMTYRTEREMLADKAAIQGSAHKNLISIFNRLLRYKPGHNYTFVPAIADPQTLEVRIRSLTHGTSYHPIVSWKNMFISMFSLGIIFIFIILPVSAIELHENGNDVMVFCVQTNYFQSPSGYSSLR